MKRKIIFLTFILVIFSLCIIKTAIATENTSDLVVSLQINNPIMEVNGIDTEIDAGRGTTPVIINNRTLVPIRAIVEAFGGNVGWDDATKSISLIMKDDLITMSINDSTAYINNEVKYLDVPPTIINDRTMLPIRFIAEGFNLGVAWEENIKTVSIIRNTFDDAEYKTLMSTLPAYSGQPYTHINNNTPLFEEYEIIKGSFEYYSDLDALGRCNVGMASISTDIMPTGERESISSVTPTGWKNKSYDIISGGYIYNRCHLIGYQLTGENANERNLITGTRYLNIEGMLPFENMVDEYIDSTGNHVMYRSTPVFTANNLVADGVLIEAYSVEDNGNGISFCVFCYNVQPYITINYATGENFANDFQSSTQPEQIVDKNNSGYIIYRTPTGKRYHLDPDCGGGVVLKPRSQMLKALV